MWITLLTIASLIFFVASILALRCIAHMDRYLRREIARTEAQTTEELAQIGLLRGAQANLDRLAHLYEQNGWPPARIKARIDALTPDFLRNAERDRPHFVTGLQHYNGPERK